MKEIALSLLRHAASLYPPLATLLHTALDALALFPSGAAVAARSLAEDVRGILPARSLTREALDDLDELDTDTERTSER